MLTSMLMSTLAGSGTGWVTSIISSYFRNRHLERMTAQTGGVEAIRIMNSGKDTAGPLTRAARSTIAYGFCGVFCYIMLHIIVWSPDTKFEVMIDKQNSFFADIFTNTVGKDSITISAGSLLWDFKHMVMYIVGFYFSRMGKG